MLKKTNVVMLPTEEKSRFILLKGVLKVTNFEGHAHGIHHMYFISENDKTINGDYCYDPLNNEILVAPEGGFAGKRIKKIIASTDKSLCLPEPSTGFVTKFVTNYFEGNIIKSVSVEYEEIFNSRTHEAMGCGSGTFIPKVNKKDNTITIKRLKNTYSEEDVRKLFARFSEHVDDQYRQYTTNNVLAFESKDSWLDKNL